MAEKFDIASKITALVLEQCEEQPETLVLSTTQFADLGFDWLARMQLVMSIEEEFSLIISDEDAAQLVSIQAVVTYLQAHTTK